MSSIGKTGMMGLGTKRITSELVHPAHLSKLRRADEILSDLVVLGALLTFSIGLVAWLIVEKPPMVMFESYDDGDVVRSFVVGIVIQTALYLLICYLMDERAVLARMLIFVIAAGFFFGLGLRIFLTAEVKSHAILFGLAAIYSLIVAAVALVQAISLAPSPSRRPAGK